MERARGIDDFVGDPVGRFDVGSTHLVWCHSPSLCGTVHWGQPSEAQAHELIRRLEVTRHPSLTAGFDVLMDARAMESFDWPAFSVISEYVKTRLGEWSQRIRKHAIAVPRGLAGVHVAGLIPLLGPNHPLRFFPSLEEALEWLGHHELPGIVEELQQVVDAHRGVSPLLHALRDYCDRTLEDASLEGAAHALGVSPRTLQRALHRFRTQFSGELTQARLRAASFLLAHSDEKVEVIARRVGCSSSSRLSALFREHLGQTPAQYREANRSQR